MLNSVALRLSWFPFIKKKNTISQYNQLCVLGELPQKTIKARGEGSSEPLGFVRYLPARPVIWSSMYNIWKTREKKKRGVSEDHAPRSEVVALPPEAEWP